MAWTGAGMIRWYGPVSDSAQSQTTLTRDLDPSRAGTLISVSISFSSTSYCFLSQTRLGFSTSSHLDFQPASTVMYIYSSAILLKMPRYSLFPITISTISLLLSHKPLPCPPYPSSPFSPPPSLPSSHPPAPSPKPTTARPSPS